MVAGLRFNWSVASGAIVKNELGICLCPITTDPCTMATLESVPELAVRHVVGLWGGFYVGRWRWMPLLGVSLAFAGVLCCVAWWCSENVLFFFCVISNSVWLFVLVW